MPDGSRADVGGTTVVVSNPGKVYFPHTGHTKLDLVRYYLAVADGALRGAGGRPNVLKRFVNGAGGEPFFQKRAPDKRPGWIETVLLSFPSGRTAEEVVPRDAAALAWMANLGCIDLNPHPVRAEDVDHPMSCGRPGPGGGSGRKSARGHWSPGMCPWISPHRGRRRAASHLRPDRPCWGFTGPPGRRRWPGRSSAAP
jgi:hypothetical protein